jgi:hypothetical protein
MAKTMMPHFDIRYMSGIVSRDSGDSHGNRSGNRLVHSGRGDAVQVVEMARNHGRASEDNSTAFIGGAAQSSIKMAGIGTIVGESEYWNKPNAWLGNIKSVVQDYLFAGCYLEFNGPHPQCIDARATKSLSRVGSDWSERFEIGLLRRDVERGPRIKDEGYVRQA